MFKKNFWMGSALFFIGISIIISGYFIGSGINSVKQNPVNIGDSIAVSKDNKVLNLPQVAMYLNMSQDEVEGIIKAEKNTLKKNSGSFDGKIFPYFIVNNKQYFYKDAIDEWLNEVSSNCSEYNTTEGWKI